MKIDNSKRIFGLDVIRSMAIFLVVLSHCTYLLDLNPKNLFVLFTRSLGAVGVDLFFVLSGYLIGGILLKQIKGRKTKFKHLLLFWKRRWFRTLPNYYLVLVLNLLLIILTGEYLPKDFYLYFFFLQNFSFPHPDFFTEAWSLSVEEYAYLVLPLFMFIILNGLVKKGKKVFLISTLSVIALLLVFKIHYYCSSEIESYKDWTTSFRKVVIYRMDSIYMGFLLVYVIWEFHSFFKKHKRSFIGLSVLIFFMLHLAIYWFGFMPDNSLVFYVFVYLNAIVISCAGSFPFFIEMNTSKYGFVNRFFYYLSTRSYSIYLVNYSLVLLTLQKFIKINIYGFNSVFLLIFYLIMTLLLSEILYSYFEKPILDYRNKKYIMR